MKAGLSNDAEIPTHRRAKLGSIKGVLHHGLPRNSVLILPVLWPGLGHMKGTDEIWGDRFTLIYLNDQNLKNKLQISTVEKK